MKKIIIAALIILAFCSGWFVWLYQMNNDLKVIGQWQDTLAAQKVELQTQIDTLTKNNEGLKSDQEKLTADLSKASEQVESISKDKGEVEIELMSANNEINQLTRQKAELTCLEADDYTFNMKSNSTVSATLKEYVGDYYGSVDKAEWKTVWNNSKTAIHNLYGEYLHSYVVGISDDVQV